MVAVSAQLESQGGAETKEQLAASSRRLHRVALFYYVLGLAQVAGVTHTVYSGDSAVARLVLVLPHGRLVNGLLYAAHTLAVLSGLFSYYTMLAVLFTTFGSCSALFRGLGAESARTARRGQGAVLFLARHHVRLVEAARRSRLLFADLFIHIVSTLLILPLLGTVELIVAVKKVDSLTVATFAALTTTFVPICLAGESVRVK
ncbi:uncharacterized protein LOC113213489 [Frankliniella occidentalis]|uniref:Uncharacterized protein LOC113213489 n=1 Tax=Frankliniella occidentalis TaxID=133901 RepID=A0A9C6WPL4_FRAOC|nr:uncharacterized protein LOC113213489 [Frankliniella occidentalis]